MAINPAVSQSFFVPSPAPIQPSPIASLATGLFGAIQQKQQGQREDMLKLLPYLINAGQAAPTTEVGPGTISSGGINFKLSPPTPGQFPVTTWSEAKAKLAYERDLSGEMSASEAISMFKLLNDPRSLYLMPPDERAALEALRPKVLETLSKISGGKETVTEAPIQSPAGKVKTKNPKISAKIKEAKMQGIPDAKIKADLIEKGYDPATYGY